MNTPTELSAPSVPERFRGRLYAFVATNLSGDVWRLSIVCDGETGHYPVIEERSTREQMEARAEHLNRVGLGLSINVAAHVVLQSMRSEGRQRP